MFRTALILGLGALLWSAPLTAQLAGSSTTDLSYLESDLAMRPRGTLLEIKEEVLDKLQPISRFALMGGIQHDYGAPTHTWISPRQADVALDRFTLQAREDLTLVSFQSVSTGNGPTPLIADFHQLGEGWHRVDLNRAIEPGSWLKRQLKLMSEDSDVREITIWLGHLPGDINMDGRLNINDGITFGLEWKGPKRLLLIDMNGDGRVNLRDATTFLGFFDQATAGSKYSAQLPAKP